MDKNIKKDFNKYIDHTLLSPTATEKDIEKLCEEAVKYDFYSVCVASCYVALAKEKLKNTSVKITSVCGFPLGNSSAITKCFEAETALKDGADEIDVVLNIGKFKDGKLEEIEWELNKISQICHNHSGILKVIIETCLLTQSEIITASNLVIKSGGDFIKTSTGFSTGGATEYDIKTIKKAILDSIKYNESGKKVEIKASGGIRTYEECLRMINAGANRLGLSRSIDIMQEYMSLT